MSWLVRVAVIAIAGLVLASGLATADCMKKLNGDVVCGKGQCQRDMHGMVLCSAFRDGSAVLTFDGRILCGKGDCVRNAAGEIFCSTLREGTAMVDLHGDPRCEGQCEPASADYCEAKAAGTTPE